MKKNILGSLLTIATILFAFAPMANATTGPGAPVVSLTTGDCVYRVIGRRVINYPHPPAVEFKFDWTQINGTPTIEATLPGNYNVYSRTYGAGTYDLWGSENPAPACMNWSGLVVTTSWNSVIDGNTYSQTCTYGPTGGRNWVCE